MAITLRLYGSPFEEPSTAEELPFDLTIPLDEEFRPVATQLDKPPYALAFYLKATDGEYVFSHIRTYSGQPFVVECVDGPHRGIGISDAPLRFKPMVISLLLDDQDEPFKGQGGPASAALYEQRLSGGVAKLHFLAIDKTPELLGQAGADHSLRLMVRNFHRAPNLNIYSKQPTGDHPQTSIQYGYCNAEVDKGIAQLLLEVWKWRFDTLASCQDKNGNAYIAFPIFSDGVAFQLLLKDAGIDSFIEAKSCGVRLQGSTERQESKTCNVYFSPLEIDQALKILQDRRERNQGTQSTEA